MKKIILFFSLLAATGMYSCDKTYHCVCSTARVIPGYAIDTDIITSTNKRSVQNVCGDFQVVQQQNLYAAGDTVNVSCSI